MTQLSDEEAIRRLVFGFYRALNEKRWDEMRSRTLDDFTVTMREQSADEGGTLTLTRDGFIGMLEKLSAHARETQHVLSSVTVDVQAERSTMSLVQYGIHVFDLPGGIRKRGDSGGGCQFELVRVDGKWLLASMQFAAYFTDPGYIDTLRSLGWPG